MSLPDGIAPWERRLLARSGSRRSMRVVLPGIAESWSTNPPNSTSLLRLSSKTIPYRCRGAGFTLVTICVTGSWRDRRTTDLPEGKARNRSNSTIQQHLVALRHIDRMVKTSAERPWVGR